jgi:hypothetical protein
MVHFLLYTVTHSEGKRVTFLDSFQVLFDGEIRECRLLLWFLCTDKERWRVAEILSQEKGVPVFGFLKMVETCLHSYGELKWSRFTQEKPSTDREYTGVSVKAS